MPHQEDPVLRNARREAIVAGLVWLGATVYCCTFCYLFGYIRPGHPRSVAELNPILGIPAWFFWGVLAPWAVCAVVSFWYAGSFVADDDLGKDHAAELESDIREGGLADG